MSLVKNNLVFSRGHTKKPHKYVLKTRKKNSPAVGFLLPDSKFKKRKNNLLSFVYVLP